MANPQPVEVLKPFQKGDDSRRNLKGRPKGSLNRSTVFKKFLGMQIDVENPANTAEKLNITLYEAAALGQLKAAIEGNTQAWVEIQNSLHGKQTDKLEINDADNKAELKCELMNIAYVTLVNELKQITTIEQLNSFLENDLFTRRQQVIDQVQSDEGEMNKLLANPRFARITDARRLLKELDS